MYTAIVIWSVLFHHRRTTLRNQRLLLLLSLILKSGFVQKLPSIFCISIVIINYVQNSSIIITDYLGKIAFFSFV